MVEPVGQAVKDQIAVLFARGASPFDIRLATGVNRHVVFRQMRRLRRPPLSERVRSPLRFSLPEREETSRGLAGGCSLRSIASGLGRAPSSVSREVARNGGRRRYRACQTVSTQSPAWNASESTSFRSRGPYSGTLSRPARWDYRPGDTRGAAMTDAQRAVWATHLHPRQTPDGFVTLDPELPLSWTRGDVPDAELRAARTPSAWSFACLVVRITPTELIDNRREPLRPQLRNGSKPRSTDSWSVRAAASLREVDRAAGAVTRSCRVARGCGGGLGSGSGPRSRMAAPRGAS